MIRDNTLQQPPALGDLATKTLVHLLAEAWNTGMRPQLCRARGASLDDVRAKLRRREAVGLGVRR